MKRLLIPGIALLALLALFQWGNTILEQTLDAKLPQLLSRELGIAVSLAPTSTRIPTLTVHSPKLVMGDPGNPALVATGVMVSLEWSDLLRGEIRLRRASGQTLMVNPSLWPNSDDPWPTDYRFLDPYLPDDLKLDSAKYIDSEGKSYAFSEPVWNRQSAGASLSWRDSVDGVVVNIGIGLESLDKLLRLARMKLQITATSAAGADSTVDVSLEVRPGKKTGYDLHADIDAAGMTAAVVAANQPAWELPQQSSTHIKQLDLEKLQALADSYRGNDTPMQAARLLAMPLPHLSLPSHAGTITIDEIRLGDEVGSNSSIDFTTGPTGISIPSLSSHGPTGVLQGQLTVTSSNTGWDLALSADLKAASADASLANAYLNAHWFWREGSGALAGKGDSWGALLNSLQGHIALVGAHHGAAVTPVSVSANLDNRQAVFALDSIELTLGEGRVSGSLALSGDQRKHLAANLKAERLNLDSLILADEAAAEPGVPIPTYLGAFPDLDLDWQLDFSALTVGGLHIGQADVTFARSQDLATVSARATGTSEAVLDLHLEAKRSQGNPLDVTLRTDLSRFNIAQLFQQATLLPNVRTSGSVILSSRGTGVEQIFKAMRGTADLSLEHRPDNGWQRPSNPEQQLQVKGSTHMVIEGSRILGLQISNLDVDSTLQDITGSVSLVEGRKPWLQADLSATKLDLANLAQFNSNSGEQTAESNPLRSLRELGASRLALQAKALVAADLTLSDVSVQLTTAPDSIDIEQMNFSLQQGRLTSKGNMTWHKDTATLSLDARVDNLQLDKFVEDVPTAAGVPLSGTVAVRSKGTSFTALLANMAGDIQLKASPGSASAASATPAEVDMTARQSADGLHADIRKFFWEGSDLAGTVLYRNSTPPMLEVEISGGALSLLPWEKPEEDTQQDAKTGDGSAVTRTARASVGLIGDVVRAPMRLISGPREAKPGEKLFSNTPLPFAALRKYQVRVKGTLDKLISREGEASDFRFSLELLGGKLEMQATAGALNGGSANATVLIDTLQQPPKVALKGTFRNLRGDEAAKASFPRSGYFEISSSGQSQAQLAAAVNGFVYTELGAGPLDYGNLMLLTADVATNMFQRLIPGVEKSKPQLECGVVLGVFKDGIGITPYGYAARTNLANLVGAMEINLKKELLHMNFSSSSRKGMGLSVGNVFSNTVEVEGSLSDPKIIPNATGILWRGWAAVMTAGLSVVGESVLKRALASDNPCTSVQKHIRKDFCTANPAANNSPMVCPPG